jgi:hypothetical protein
MVYILRTFHPSNFWNILHSRKDYFWNILHYTNYCSFIQFNIPLHLLYSDKINYNLYLNSNIITSPSSSSSLLQDTVFNNLQHVLSRECSPSMNLCYITIVPKPAR